MYLAKLVILPTISRIQLFFKECCLRSAHLRAPLYKMSQLQARSRARFTYPPEVWDSLSKIWLTTDAIRELNRRNKQTKSNQSIQQLQTRLTSNEFLRHCTEEKLRDIKWFARHGGPDLLDLRQVFILISFIIGLYN
jgi:hypothetical protein